MTTPRFCYVEIPTDDADRSSRFYARVFGWSLRQRGDGAIAFDDGGEISGVFIEGRRPQDEHGFTWFVMVDDAEASVATIEAEGGVIVSPLGSSEEITALFRDPSGNVLGVYQEPPQD